MSKIEVNQVDPQSGTTLTLGTSGDTISIPAGVTLANSGTATGFASIAWQSTIVTTSTLTAVAGNGYWIDTTSNACTVTLPGSASVGDQIIFVDYARKWGTNAITINTNSLNFQGNTSPNPEYNTSGQSVSIVYSGATKGWIPTVDDDVTLETPQSYSVDFLVIAGGGGGGEGGNQGGGGGAGGYRNSYNSESSGGGGSAESSLTFTQNTTYTITVGAGGAGQTGTDSSGATGTDSSISGTGITTITSSGGGGGGGLSSGLAGGSGGGGGTESGTGAKSGGSGTANQGYAGGSGQHVYPVWEGAGGGGGAGGAGSYSRNNNWFTNCR
jgi:hypothetical protein